MNTRNRTPLVIAIVLVVVAIVAIAVVVLAGGDDDDPAGTESTDGGAGTSSTLPEIYDGEVLPITIEGSALPPLPQSDDDGAIGMAAPVLVGESFDGSAVTTASDGGPVMVVFLAHWCPHCNDEIPRLIGLEEEGRFPDDLKIVGVSTAVAPDRPNFPPSEWIVDKGWPWPILADGVNADTGFFAGAEAFGVNGFPFITIVGADGNVLGRWSGESAPDDFIAKLDAALAA